MANTLSGCAKVGVFVDISNIYMNGGQRMRYDVLRHYAQSFGMVQRLNAYPSYDAERAEDDREYRDKTNAFHDVLRSFGYHTSIKPVRWYIDPDTERRFGKANADVDMVIDLISQAHNLDHIILVTGDGDFVRPIQYVRNLGCRVEVLGFDNVSQELRKEADVYTSGYLIPELIPTNPRNVTWGSVGSTVRGVCYYHQADENYGFLAFMEKISPLAWISDPRLPDSPYKAVFFHDTALPPNINPNSLPSRHIIFEFEIAQTERGFVAENMRVIGSRADSTSDRITKSAVRGRGIEREPDQTQATWRSSLMPFSSPTENWPNLPKDEIGTYEDDIEEEGEEIDQDVVKEEDEEEGKGKEK
jgi:uncharacterized LabA/DUF88 family protein